MNSSTLYWVLAVMLALLVFVQPAVQVASEEVEDKRTAHNIMRFGRGHNIMRFGRAGHNIMHFGKRGDAVSDETSAGYAAAPQAYASEYQLPSSEQAVLDTLLSSYNYNKKASDPRDLRERDNVFMHFG